MTAERAGLDLVLVRHADAGDPAVWTGADAERPLSSKGRKQAGRLGKLLREIRLEPDAIVTSPKIRAAETAAAIGEAIGIQVRIDDRLAEGFGLAELDAIVGEGSFKRPILVGHDPDFSELVGLLVGAEIQLRKGALARIEVLGDLDASTGACALPLADPAGRAGPLRKWSGAGVRRAERPSSRRRPSSRGRSRPAARSRRRRSHS